MDSYRSFIKKSLYIFDVFLLWTDIMLLILSFVYGMEVMKYVVYVKMVLNVSNIFLIRKEKYALSLGIMYLVIIIFMISAVMCLGLDYGFHLYVFSMTTVIYYSSYMTSKISADKIKTNFVMAIIVLCYAFCYVYSKIRTPLYVISDKLATVFFVINSVIVLGILIVFSKIFVGLIGTTESKLEELALVDKLTGLYNRHYFLNKVENIPSDDIKTYRLAIIDIDDFKKVNDVYGHNCGDVVLQNVASIMKTRCSRCINCRWGGEEFIIFAGADVLTNALLEDFRKTIEDTTIISDGTAVKVTITIGVSDYSSGHTIDEWVSSSDARLYEGKQTGKNKVVA